MTAVDPRAPVVVGVGQVNQHMETAAARPPIELLTEAARRAEADSGASLLGRADIVAVVAIGSWPYADPGAFLARELGIEPRATAVSTVGGNSPQLLVDEFATRIQRGECDVVLIGGAESMHTRWSARKEPRVHLTWDSGADEPCDWVIGDARPGASDIEMAHLAVAPTMVYPLLETALRHHLGHTFDAHQEYVSTMWARFSDVAAGNPHAWSQSAFTPEAIRTVSAANRMVCVPYPKRMCSNIDVDQGAALFLCAYETARSAGVADDRMVFLHAAAEAHDHYFFTERATLHDSPAIAACAGAAFAHAGTTIDDVAHIDLYSCFPSAVQISRAAIGIGPTDSRALTVTGGLGFAGGPLNNYPTHAIAGMVDTLRLDPDAYGVTTALGWYVTKHALALWSAQPPARPFAVEHVQAVVDAGPRRSVTALADGDATIEATSISVERDGSPSVGIISVLCPDDSRALATTHDPDLLTAMSSEAWEGRTVKVTNDGKVNTLQ